MVYAGLFEGGVKWYFWCIFHQKLSKGEFMRFFSDVMGIIWEDWGIYVLIFGRNGDNFGSYWHKWVGNFELLRGVASKFRE